MVAVMHVAQTGGSSPLAAAPARSRRPGGPRLSLAEPRQGPSALAPGTMPTRRTTSPRGPCRAADHAGLLARGPA